MNKKLKRTLVLIPLVLASGLLLAQTAFLASNYEDSGWKLKRGSTVIGQNYLTEDLCKNAALLDKNSRKKTAKYECSGKISFKLIWKELTTPVDPDPVDPDPVDPTPVDPTPVDPMPGMGMMPIIDKTTIPTGSAGVNVEQFVLTQEQPGESDGTGAFRTTCDFSHMAYDDPIVYPGQPGVSHLHAFFGNTGANANSTADSIATTGNSTCRGGTLNRSSYWVPPVVDTRTGKVIKPNSMSVYYKTGYRSVNPADVNVFPYGLRMIAGDMKNDNPGEPWATTGYGYSCVSSNGSYGEGREIPQCNSGDDMVQHVYFPQCWDGVNLDSPDHKSHMAYPEPGQGCPASHPVAVPEITYNVPYTVGPNDAPGMWRLSSDNYSINSPGGYSGHGDWFMGWKPEAMKAFVDNCDKPAKDCHSHLLGDGRAIY